jgi:transposase
MNLLYPQSAGLDVHKKTVVACALTVDAHGEMHEATQTFATMTPDLLALADWLGQQGVTHVAMESTGEYWKPVHSLLEGNFTVLVVNAQHLKTVPGRKTDVGDAAWIADLLRHGLLTGSYIPPLAQRDLRDLTRQRTNLVQERAQVSNTLQKVLEWANLKLGDVVSDVTGVSARAMLTAIVDGQTDPTALAELARGRLRSKRAILDRALVGRVRPHHRFLLRQHLTHLDFLEEQIAQFDEQIASQLATTFPAPGGEPPPPRGDSAEPPVLPLPPAPLGAEQALALLDTIPGVARRVAETLLAEIGTEVTRFRSAKSLARWARLCPGNNESAGKRLSGRIGAGNPNLRAALVQAAHAAVRVKECYLARVYQRLVVHRGAKRAIIAVAHRILIATYHILLQRQPYADHALVVQDAAAKLARLRRRIQRDGIERDGYRVTIELIPSPP